MEIVVIIFTLLLVGSLPWMIYAQAIRKSIVCSTCGTKVTEIEVALTTKGEWCCFSCFREGKSKILI